MQVLAFAAFTHVRVEVMNISAPVSNWLSVGREGVSAIDSTALPLIKVCLRG